MATQAELIELAGLIRVAYDRVLELAGQPSIASLLAAKDAQIATLTSERDAAQGQVTTLQGKLTTAIAAAEDAIAADTLADQQEAARLSAILTSLQ